MERLRRRRTTALAEALELEIGHGARDGRRVRVRLRAPAPVHVAGDLRFGTSAKRALERRWAWRHGGATSACSPGTCCSPCCGRPRDRAACARPGRDRHLRTPPSGFPTRCSRGTPDHVPVRLRARGRVRRRRARGDRADARTRGSSTSAHGIPRQDVLAGALIARARAAVRAARRAPRGRRPRGRRARGARSRCARAQEDRLLVGPDNGLLLAGRRALRRRRSRRSRSPRSPWRLEPVSATFHGRDVFAPVAARLAAGDALAEAGDADRPGRARRGSSCPRPRVEDGAASSRTRSAIDGFGNVLLDARTTQLAGRGPAARAAGRGDGRRRGGGARTCARSPTSRPGELLLYEDASGTLALAVNGGAAARALGLAPRRRAAPAAAP